MLGPRKDSAEKNPVDKTLSEGAKRGWTMWKAENSAQLFLKVLTVAATVKAFMIRILAESSVMLT